MTLLAALSPGDKVRLCDFGQTPIAYRRRLLSLGLTYTSEVKVLRIAPLGCPVLLEICGTAVAVRQEDARFLQWERL